ncbi:hypothetical protein TRFO_35280 [Tritrichomonas foetus]|uniref:Uncharacterized protein n=1 Tax=Tritrichomonas foetus TaxID=1144522 RepID=A0A1J4JGN1_9EUKA|nr:hypothetical protein TRFO_35280 [Tritrichomonas foetus]|eukprot:OHS98306.1 hypothetical protein TRFO_35280 [Tritrichomonas foetus]
MFYFTFLCIYTIKTYGFYTVDTRVERCFDLYLEKSSTIIIRYEPQEKEFLEAIISNDDDDKDIKYMLDPGQSAMIHGKYVNIHIKTAENIPRLLDFWVIPQEICPNISFELPNKTDYSFFLHSNILNESICVFMPKLNYNQTQVVHYGLNTENQSQIVLYSNFSKKLFLKPLKICNGLFCKANIYFSSFFTLNRIDFSPISLYIDVKSLEIIDNSYLISNIHENNSLFDNNSILNDNSIDFDDQSHNGDQIRELLPIPIPIPFYNFTGRYNFEKIFDKKSYQPISHPTTHKYTITFVTMISATVLMSFTILLKLFVKYSIHKNHKESANTVSHDRRPLTVVLNRYCPTTSSALISMT